MRISVIIPAFNEERLLEETLRCIHEAITAFTERGWPAEVIVCDNNSTDRTAEVARNAGAQVVFEPVNQIGRARNRGASEASGDWLIFVDADSFPDKSLFGAVAGQIAGGSCVAGGCLVQLERGYPTGQAIVRLWNWLSRSFHLLAGSFIFCEASVFREVGGFSQELYAGEELDLTKKLKRLALQRGRKLVILDQHSLVTSARKMHLYTFREYAWFLAKAALRPGRVLRSREACHTWYDGRR